MFIFFKNCLHWTYKIAKILCKIIYIEYIELFTLFEKMCTLNIQNCIQSLKNCVYWMYKIVYILRKIVYIKYTNIQN